MSKRSRDRERREKSRERKRLTLEMKVRALKLLRIDNYEPEDILLDLENSFGLKITNSAWQDARKFLRQIENSIKELICNEGRHTQRLLKLLTQAQLIDLTGGTDE